MKYSVSVPFILLASAVVIVSAILFTMDPPASSSDVTANTTDPATTQTVNSVNASNDQTTNELLLYLIEEEKLAHDVYTVMYEKYGANVFGNILNSEPTHQSKVLTLLQTRGIADPRSSEIGVFVNQDLQNLYSQLITQGNLSAIDAYKVGVIIEEKDIADITYQLATATDADVVATLEQLRSGSENHLRAFNRKPQ